MSFDLLEFRKLIKKNRIILSFEGIMSQDVLRSLVETLEEKILRDHDDKNDDNREFIAKRIYSVFIELAQNIQKYSFEQGKKDSDKGGSGIIVIGEEKDYFAICSGNLIEINKANKLVDYCQEINSYDASQIRKMYREVLKLERQPGQMGAGVGLLDILKKSKQPLGVELKEVMKNNLL